MVLHSLLGARTQRCGHLCVLRRLFDGYRYIQVHTLHGRFVYFLWFSRSLTVPAIYLVRRVVVVMSHRFDLVYLGNWKINRNDSGKLNRCTEHKLICRMKCIGVAGCRCVCVYTRTKRSCLFYLLWTWISYHVHCASEPPTETLATQTLRSLLLVFSLLSHTGTTRVRQRTQNTRTPLVFLFFSFLSCK